MKKYLVHFKQIQNGLKSDNAIIPVLTFKEGRPHNCSSLPRPKMDNSDKKENAATEVEKEVKNAKGAKKQKAGSKTNINKKMPFKGKAKKMPFKGKAKNMPIKKTQAAAVKVNTMMADFQSGERESRVKTALGGVPLKDFSESATSLLLSDYKVEDEKILSTTALAM